jgi:hypothetical protein
MVPSTSSTLSAYALWRRRSLRISIRKRAARLSFPPRSSRAFPSARLAPRPAWGAVGVPACDTVDGPAGRPPPGRTESREQRRRFGGGGKGGRVVCRADLDYASERARSALLPSERMPPLERTGGCEDWHPADPPERRQARFPCRETAWHRRPLDESKRRSRPRRCRGRGATTTTTTTKKKKKAQLIHTARTGEKRRACGCNDG